MGLANRTTVLALAASAGVASGCVEAPEPAADPRAGLFDAVVAMSYWTWDRPPGLEERAQGKSPHGAFAEIYVSDRLSDALTSMMARDTWPADSIVVHEGWDGQVDGGREHVTVMDRRGGGWTFAQFDGLGEYVETTEVYCAACHEHGEDFVRSFPLPQPEDG